MNDYSVEIDLSEHDALTIGILSDTHGSLNPDIEAFIQQCDIALHAGDMMGADSLRALKPKMGQTFAVKGNNDAHSTWEPEDHAILDDIPDQVTLHLPGGMLVMEHAHRVWDRDVGLIHQALRRDHPDVELIVYGHTHIRTIDDQRHPPVINPGAAGRVRVHDGPSCLELRVNADKWEIREHLFQVD